MFTYGMNQERSRVICIDFYTTRGVAPWCSEEGMQLQHMKHRLLYNQKSRPLMVRRENAHFSPFHIGSTFPKQEVDAWPEIEKVSYSCTSTLMSAKQQMNILTHRR